MRLMLALDPQKRPNVTQFILRMNEFRRTRGFEEGDTSIAIDPSHHRVEIPSVAPIVWIDQDITRWRLLVDDFPKDPLFFHSLQEALNAKGDKLNAVLVWKQVYSKHRNSREAALKLRAALIVLEDWDLTIECWLQAYYDQPFRISFLEYLQHAVGLKWNRAPASLPKIAWIVFLSAISKRLMSWGAEGVNWSPLASQDELWSIIPYAQKRVWRDVHPRAPSNGSSF